MNDEARKRSVLNLAFVWGLSLLLSVSATSVSVYVLLRDRIDYSCDKNGHSFEPRYDTVPPPATEVSNLDISWAQDKLAAVEKMTKTVYVGDVCSYCAKSVKRQ